MTSQDNGCISNRRTGICQVPETRCKVLTQFDLAETGGYNVASRPSDQPMNVRANGGDQNKNFMPKKYDRRTSRVGGSQIPQARSIIPAASDEPMAIGADGNRIDKILMTTQ